MFTKKILALFAILITVTVYGQKNFIVNNDRPKAGDIITFTYVPSGSIANTLNPVEGIVYTSGSKGLSAEDIVLKNEGGKYSGTIKTDTSNNFVYFGFSANKNFDNNFNDGYWVQLYEGDKLKKGSNISLAQFYQVNGSRVGLDPNPAKAAQYMENEFVLFPESRKQSLTTYISLLSATKKAEAPVLIQKEIEGFLKEGLKEESDYTLLQNLYTIAKLPQQAVLINSVMKEKFPAGKWTILEAIQRYGRETDIAKKKELHDQLIQKISADPSLKSLQANLSSIKSALLQAYITKKDWAGLKNQLQTSNITGAQLASVYNNAAWQIQETGENLRLAEEFARNAINYAKSEWQNPTAEKPLTLTKKQWDRNREGTYGMYADTYAMVFYRMGEYKKGFPYAKESAIAISKGEFADNNNTYALLAEKTMPSKKYKKDLEQFVKEAKATSTIKEILKRAYIKENRSGKGFDEYIAGLEKESYLNMVAELRKSMLNEAVPSFALYDLNKNKVDIADLKNKVVVVDFWATWCGPCKASFPGMQKMVNKFKDNPEVKFVFVDTWERGEDKHKDASDFIAANKYTFHVLEDIENKVVEQFKVNGIPTKFVIDKNGMIRFKAIGFDGSDEKLISELTAMIEMATDQSKKM